MKLYVFSHTMLKPIHQGVQGMHALANLFLNAATDNPEHLASICSWARDYRTIITKDGGISTSLNTLANAFSEAGLLTAKFMEDESTLEGVMTSVAVLLPHRMWMMADYLRQSNPEAAGFQLTDDIVSSKYVRYEGNEVVTDTYSFNYQSFTPEETRVIGLCNKCGLA